MPRAISFAHPDPAGELVILPERTVLRGQGARQQLLIERRLDGRFVGSHAEDATFSSSNPARGDGGRVRGRHRGR